MPPQTGSPLILARDDGATIAYHALAPTRPDRPGIVFLTGFMSDMTGAKALHIDHLCREQGLGFVRFDFFGHGASSGAFAGGTIGRWKADALAVLDRLTRGKQVLVGSSMGGWIMLLAALARPERIAGLVGIAAAPDFTEELIWDKLPAPARAAIERAGSIEQPSAYGARPYTVTKRLIEEGRDHLVLRGPVALSVPVRLVHGMRDPDVPWQTALRLSDALTGSDVVVTLIKDGEHRLSRQSDLDRIGEAVLGLAGRTAV